MGGACIWIKPQLDLYSQDVDTGCAEVPCSSLSRTPEDFKDLAEDI